MIKFDDLLHGDEEIVLAELGYHNKSHTSDTYEPENGAANVTPHKREGEKI